MQLTKILDRLSEEELGELLFRWGFEDNGKVSRRALAETLLQKRLLSGAFRHLDAFQLKLFRWILQQPGYEAKWSSLLDALSDRVPAAYLEQELQDVRLWGLIDFRAAKDGFVGTYPAAAVGFPSVAVSLRDQLAPVGTESLRQVCSNLGIKNPPTIKEGRLTAILRTLSDQEACRAIVDSLPPASRGMLEWVRSKGGKVSLAEILQRPGSSSARQMHPLPSYYPYAPEGDSVLDLTRRCLLLPVSNYPGYWLVDWFVVPEEVERALTGCSFFDDGPLQPPPLDTAEDATGSIPNPLHVVRDVGHLLGFVASGRCEWRQDREPYVRSLTAFGKMVKHPDKGYPAALWTLCTAAGLLYLEEYWSPEYTAAAVDSPDPARLAQFLVEAWALGGPGGIPDLPTGYSVVGARQSILGLLGSMPTDVWVTQASMLRHLAFRRPLLFGLGPRGSWPEDWDTMRYLAFAAGTTSTGEPAIMVPSTVRPLFPSRENAPSDALPPWDDSWVIQPDRTIIVPPNAPPRSLRGLWQVAQLEDNQGAAIFRLSADSVARALNRGMTPADVEATLRRGSKTELPNTVQRLLQDQGKRYGQIKLGSALTYVRTEDPAILEAIAHDRKLSTLKWRILAPGVAAVENAAPATVLETLRKAGHLPVMEETTAAAATGQPAPIGALAGDPAARRQIESLLREAIGLEAELSMKWKQNGRTRTATVTPYKLTRGVISAFSYSGTEYEIPLDSLVSLEALEDFDEDDDLFEDDE